MSLCLPHRSNHRYINHVCQHCGAQRPSVQMRVLRSIERARGRNFQTKSGDPYVDGFMAKGQGYVDNPYEPGTDEAQLWQLGWDDALKEAA